MSGHTPGPWHVRGDEPWNLTVNASPEDRVCFLAHNGGRDDDRDFANARLIAAAPDLLEALEDVLDGLGFLGGGDHELEGHGISLERAKEIRAVLARAWGETP